MSEITIIPKDIPGLKSVSFMLPQPPNFEKLDGGTLGNCLLKFDGDWEIEFSNIRDAIVRNTNEGFYDFKDSSKKGD